MESQSNAETYVRVGKVKDAHGIKGELFVVLFAGEAAWIDDLDTLRLVPESGGAEPKIFTIKSARLHKNGLIAKTEELKDRNAAEALKGLLLEVPEEFLVSESGESIFLREVLGFRVVEKVAGDVGFVRAFSSNGFQDLLVVETKTGDYEVPFVEAFVERIDYEARTMHLDLPVGLLGENDEAEEEGSRESQASDEDEDESGAGPQGGASRGRRTE